MKTVAIIGLGKFGFYVAKSLSRLNHTVIAVDNDENKIQEISEYVDNAFVIDSTSKQALEEVGIYNLSTVIVSIGENIESSILTVMALKDLNNKNIIAKAITSIHGEILSKIGAFKVIYPEKLAGRLLVKKLVQNITVDEIDLSNSVKMVKFLANKKVISHTIGEIQEYYNEIRIVSYKTEGEWVIVPDLNHTVKENDILVFLGKAEFMQDLYKKICSES
ncbi:TrkA family potassium uptake protein [Arcobacter sp. CECT 8985]|uniref:potassium channel family protein n=1 Tax=Arcobacter sp. CECT 8985 TaxID=1935424 RepID=UPI00100A3AD1|nr:TrkA family potassium uptake protein [Arcobacter sp. CECT 8985]RXJ88223.1 potassium transporter TrkA [Arcobacter sp. CECT 8985]